MMDNRTGYILGATLGGLVLLGALVYWLTGTVTVWWSLVGVFLTFAILAISGAFKRNKDRS